MTSKKSKLKILLRKIINIFIAVLTIITISISSYLLKKWYDETKMFDLKKIIVKNDYLISKGEIIELSKLKRGTRVFNIDIEKVEIDISKSKYINSASIEIIYPATIVINVSEEKPLAYCLDKNRLKFVDEKGNIMGNVNPYRAVNLPIILDERYSDEIIELLNESKAVSEFVYHKISEISYKKSIGVILTLTQSSTKVIIGRDDFDKKILVLENFLRDRNNNIAFNKTEYIDLRFQNQVIVKENISNTENSRNNKG